MSSFNSKILFIIFSLWLISLPMIVKGGFYPGLFESIRIQNGEVKFSFPVYEVFLTILLTFSESVVLFLFLWPKTINVSLWRILVAALIFGIIGYPYIADGEGYLNAHQNWMTLISLILLSWAAFNLFIRILKKNIFFARS